MSSLRAIGLDDVSVHADTPVHDAARALFASGLSAIAVLDESGRLTGLFTEDDLLRALFPGYLSELRHTAFAPDDELSLARRVAAAAEERTGEWASEALVVELESSLVHVAERFLHTDRTALAVVDGRRFVGMLPQLRFIRALLGGT
jgi:CBS domain-containing protein